MRGVNSGLSTPPEIASFARSALLSGGARLTSRK